MKTNKLVSLVFLTVIFLTQSCNNEPLNLEPKSTINCTPIGLGDSHPKNQDYQKILDKYVAKGFPGITAAIYTPENGLWVGASGLSDIKNRIAMSTCNTLFSGSVAKLYTVTAGMILYEQGKLELDAKISKFLPQNIVDNLPNAKEATIRQLMNHSAGMPDHDDEEGLSKYLDRHKGNLPSAEEQLTYLYDNAPNFPAGSAVQYSSAHTLTLSIVLDNIAGEHHSNIISRDIIQKIGLEDTYYKNEPSYPTPPNLVRGYVDGASKNQDITTFSINYCNGSQGDAGVIATANDYYLFLKALMEGRIIKQSTLDIMMKPTWAAEQSNLAVGYGLGLFIGQKDNEFVKVGHSGATAGGMSHVYYYPKADAYIIVLTNTIAEDNMKLAQLWSVELILGTGSENITAEIESIHLK